MLQKVKTEAKIKMATNVAPAITAPAPQFTGTAVVGGQFKQISLSDYKGKYVVFFFYPLDFTFVCSTESHFSHLAWINTPRKQGGLGSMDIPLLSDKNCAISQAYGVYKPDDGVTFRGLFIIDGEQKLRQVTINDLPVGRDVDEVLRLVQAFQYTDVHGEVCPAGWKPGKKTMKPGVEESKEYFSAVNVG